MIYELSKHASHMMPVQIKRLNCCGIAEIANVQYVPPFTGVQTPPEITFAGIAFRRFYSGITLSKNGLYLFTQLETNPHKVSKTAALTTVQRNSYTHLFVPEYNAFLEKWGLEPLMRQNTFLNPNENHMVSLWTWEPNAVDLQEWYIHRVAHPSAGSWTPLIDQRAGWFGEKLIGEEPKKEV